MFWRFSVISFRARWLWHSAIAAPKSVKNDAQIHENSAQIHPKLVKMVTQSVPKVILEASRRNVIHREFSETIFGATWVISGGILRPAGRQGAPKIGSFGIKSHKNLKK